MPNPEMKCKDYGDSDCNHLPNPETWEPLDNAVRDICKIGVKTKSEVRRILTNLLTAKEQEMKAEFVENLKQLAASAVMETEEWTLKNIQDLIKKYTV